MERMLSSLLLLLCTLIVPAQNVPALEQLQADPRKAYGTDYPYGFRMEALTPAPRGYKPFYISLYARHGSRYYHTDRLYKKLDTLLTAAHEKDLLTGEGEAFYSRYQKTVQELITGFGELTEVGWQQHQDIACTLYNRFPEVFRKGGNVLAVASLAGRSVMSMSAFCQELVQCNPRIEIREESSRFTLDAVIPTYEENPNRREWPMATGPRCEKRRNVIEMDTTLNKKILTRVFKSTEGLPGNVRQIPGYLISLYTSLPSINHEGMMEGILSDGDLVKSWESNNLRTYSDYFRIQYRAIPILSDIILKADAVLDGSSDRIADLRFGHDNIGALIVLMGLNGADLDPEDPLAVKECFQNWNICKAANIQLVFYRGRHADDPILVKCLLNGSEVTLPVATDRFPYYSWSGLKAFYLNRIEAVE